MANKFKHIKIVHTPIEGFVVSFIWLFLCIISGWVTDCADIDNYKSVYENTSLTEQYITGFNNPGYHYIYSVFQSLGISFEKFHILFFVGIMTFLVRTVWKYSRKPVIVLLLYIVVGFVGDIIQMKNTLALVFLYIALTGIIDKGKEYNKLVLATIILLSATVHIGFLVYLVILLYDKKINSTLYILLMIVSSVVGHSVLQIFANFVVLYDAGPLVARTESYIANRSIFSVFACSFVYLVNLFTCKRYLVNCKDINISIPRLMNVNVLLSVIIIFSSVNMTFFRLFRNIILFNSIFIINGYVAKQQKTIKDLLIIVFYYMVMSYFFLLSGDIWENVAIIFQNNSFF